jgi:trk system potassium uptake protein
MKRFIIVGLGNFGSTVAESLYGQGHDVIALDRNEDAVDRIASHVSRAAVGDGRQADMLDRVGAREADAAIISTGDDITASVLTTMALRDLGVKDIYVKVISRDHARVMARLGATETVFPERESAQNLATRLSDQSVLNYVRIGGGFSIQEMVVPDKWEGKTLRELQLPLKYKISVVAMHDVLTDLMTVPPNPDAPLKDTDTLIVAGTEDALRSAAQAS